MKVLRIDAPHFVAGLVLHDNDYVETSAPIIKYMKGWNEERIRTYCASKGWQVDEV